MRYKNFIFTLTVFLISILIFNFSFEIRSQKNDNSDPLIYPGEVHFQNMKQLTFGGENAEAYFSFDGKKLVFQSTRDNFECDQIYTMNIDGSDVRLISTGEGRTTCAYFLPGDERVIFSSTHVSDPHCPHKPDYSRGYVWPIYDSYNIYISDLDGNILQQLTSENAYDAEATVSPKGDKIVFTSTRNGDLDIYTMNIDGTGVRQLTDEPGYDGGAFFSPDGSKIVYRRTRFGSPEEIEDYKSLLKENLIRPNRLDIYVMDADGGNKIKVTDNEGASFAPFFHPGGEKIIFASNMHDPKGRNFDLYMVDIDGTGLERITFFEDFDGFPMFSPDGKKFVFCSNRNNNLPGETNIFICDWME
jgi:TolB protein